MPLSREKFSEELIRWYYENKRALPWRDIRDPYKIWLSEVILQQTRVVQGRDYYVRFTKAFPNVKALADASQDQVLRLWQGLGYYSRARNLHHSAKVIAYDLGGRFPDNYKDLLKLKGVGKYTAAAIASFAFHEHQAVLDGNVFRVLARVFAIRENIADSKAQKAFAKKALEVLPLNNSWDHNQAVMEFGALQCLPKNPLCGQCPFERTCAAKLKGLEHLLPVKEKAVKKRERFFSYVSFINESKVWMRKRGNNDIWAGLYEHYLIENKNLDAIIENLLKLRAFGTDASALRGRLQEKYRKKHILTHQNLEIGFYVLMVSDEEADVLLKEVPKGSFVTREEVFALPKPVPVAGFIEKFNY